MSPLTNILLAVVQSIIALAMIVLTIHLLIAGPMLAAIPTVSMAFFMGFFTFRDVKSLLANNDTPTFSAKATDPVSGKTFELETHNVSASNVLTNLNANKPFTVGVIGGVLNTGPKTVFINGEAHTFLQSKISFEELTKIVYGKVDVVPTIVCRGPKTGMIRFSTSIMPNMSFALEEGTSFEVYNKA